MIYIRSHFQPLFTSLGTFIHLARLALTSSIQAPALPLSNTLTLTTPSMTTTLPSPNQASNPLFPRLGV